MGFIYKITNTINDKVYIGKTTRTIEERWKEHLNSIKDKDFKIYRAFRKYGVKTFLLNQLKNVLMILSMNEKFIGLIFIILMKKVIIQLEAAKELAS